MKLKIRRQIYLPMRINQVLSWSQNILLMIGILVLSYVGYAQLDSWLYQADQTRQFEQSLKTVNLSSVGSVGVARLEAAPLGRIEISSVGLMAMIQEGVDEKTLQRSVGHIPGTSLPGQAGNIALAGHRDTFFRQLRKIRQDDEIKLTTLSGTDRYRVDSIKVVEPEQTQVLDDLGDDLLTLVTCYPFNFVGSAPRRFIVRARKIPAS